jgi:HK97 family phage major capsid protein
MKTVEKREKRAKLITQARDLWSAATAKEGGPTAEDKQEFDRLMDEGHRLKDEIEREDRLEAATRSLDEPEQRRSDPMRPEPRGGDQPTSVVEYRNSPQYRAVYSDWLATGQLRQERIPAEFRDTIIGTDAKGGFLATPTVLANELVRAVDNLTFVRQLARVFQLTEGKTLGVPRLSARMADANWTTEVAAVTEDTTMGLDRPDITPQLLSKLAKVSMRSLAGISNIETVVMDELAYAFAITEEKGYLTGNGTAPNPLGMFTANANGIPAARDVSTGNTATALGAQNLFEMKYALKAGYRADPSTRWLWSRPAINTIMQLKDSQNRYLWESSLQAGQPDRLLNIPVAESEYVPATFTTGQYVGLLGAMRYYWIAEVPTAFSMQRLTELYAATSEVGFIGRRFLSGAPVLGEAFVRSKLA